MFNRSLVNLCLSVLIFTGSMKFSGAQALVNEIDGENVFTVVEDMPIPWLYKTECLEVRSADKRDCYMEKLNFWLGQQLVYPDEAVRAKTEGNVVMQFVVDRSGAIRDAVILKDIGNGCGDAARKAVEKMPDWIPGRQRGVPVNVRYTIPVKFDLK